MKTFNTAGGIAARCGEAVGGFCFLEGASGVVKKLRVGSDGICRFLIHLLNHEPLGKPLTLALLLSLFTNTISYIFIQVPDGHNRESGANPLRTRHCKWGRKPQQLTA